VGFFYAKGYLNACTVQLKNMYMYFATTKFTLQQINCPAKIEIFGQPRLDTNFST